MKKKVLIYGLGKSGRAVEKFYKDKKINPFLFDDNQELHSIENVDFKTLDLAVVSPGIDEEKELYKKLERNSVKIISELELGFQNVKGNIIAITGTNGKTTTVSLLGHILNCENKNTFIGGNIGTPLISFFGKTNRKSKIVCEVSSFQLLKTEKFRPKISAILNLAPDHLTRHKTFENYIEAKCQIFKNQKKNDFCLLNYDDERVKSLSERIKAKKYYFSMQNQEKNTEFVGVFAFDQKIFFKSAKKIELIMATDGIKLVGKKNLENVLSAIMISILCKVKKENITLGVNSFLPLPNRLETVLSLNGITYVNDSKATNVASTLTDIAAFSESTVLLLGGSDKGEDFKALFEGLPPNVCKSIIYGETKEEMRRCTDELGYTEYIVSENFEEAFLKGREICETLAKNGVKSILLLSPACASFDEFKNYEERGDKFKLLVKTTNL